MRVVQSPVSLVLVLASVSTFGCTSQHECGGFVDWGTDEIVDDAGQDASDSLEESFDASAATGDGDAELTSPDADTSHADAPEPIDASGRTDAMGPTDAGPPDSGRRIGP